MAGQGFKDFSDGNVLTAEEVDGYLMQQTIMQFPDAASRDSAVVAIASEGMWAVTRDDKMLWYRTGGVWKEARPINRYATTDINTNTSGTFTNVTGFSFPVVAGGVYAISGTLFPESGGSVIDLKFGWSWTGTGSMTAGNAGLDTNTGASVYNSTWTGHAVLDQTSSPLDESTGVAALTVPTMAFLGATFFATTAGTVQLRFAQFAANATTARLKKGSRMSVTRID
jgi:hypothetical protein